MKKNLLKSITILSLILLVLTGCSDDKINDDSPEVETNTGAIIEVESGKEEAAPIDEDNTDIILAELLTAANEVTITDTEVIFVDDSGRDQISIKKNPQKVAVLYGSHACLWVEAGGEVKIGIGGDSAIELYKEQIGRNILEDEGVVTVANSSSGKNWDIETILAEQPDLIICSTAMSGYSTISGPAEAAGIPVIAMTYSGVGDYLKWSKVFSNINDKPELFEEIAMNTAKEVANTIAKVPTENNPRVISLLPQSDAIQANLGASDMGVLIEELNGINVASALSADIEATRVEIDIETVFAENPDIIMIQCLASEEEARANLDAIFGTSPVWQSLDAVKNNKVYYMPKSLFHLRPNSQYSEAYSVMAEILYPDLSF
ncbi:MAG: ABC transporter substrate-binding protein [Tissierellia bacterium]|jgi:iron complex transport system substrate-binding protein|nr:ABC transporter substrate-binding protein [Tissierellia bacterium]